MSPFTQTNKNQEGKGKVVFDQATKAYRGRRSEAPLILNLDDSQRCFDVLLTAYLSIILVINQLNAQIFVL